MAPRLSFAFAAGCALLFLLAPVGTVNAASPTAQAVELGEPGQRYPFLVFASADLQAPSIRANRAVVVIHGIQRNAQDYFAAGEQLLANAGLANDSTLLLAPKFAMPQDDQATAELPLYGYDDWVQGDVSRQGRTGVGAFTVLDDLLRLLADRARFPALREILLIGHSAGGQLLQRYAAFSPQEEVLRPRGIALRYVVASPSSYLYFDGNRPHAGGFGEPAGADCPDYDRYRYGLQQAPAYLARPVDGHALFSRYTARDVTYVVGARDDKADGKVMDMRCGARLEGANRLERQANYLAYERFLAGRWQLPAQHGQLVVDGVGHDPVRLLGAPVLARRLFPSS
jgi:pimeloyl-ACP methyl ester carboxylesterase